MPAFPLFTHYITPHFFPCFPCVFFPFLLHLPLRSPYTVPSLFLHPALSLSFSSSSLAVLFPAVLSLGCPYNISSPSFNSNSVFLSSVPFLFLFPFLRSSIFFFFHYHKSPPHCPSTPVLLSSLQRYQEAFGKDVLYRKYRRREICCNSVLLCEGSVRGAN